LSSCTVGGFSGRVQFREWVSIIIIIIIYLLRLQVGFNPVAVVLQYADSVTESKGKVAPAFN
jgi:hypothetical protein